MEERKLNQALLDRIVYILGSYDLEPCELTDNDNHVWLTLPYEQCYVPFYVMEEIKDVIGEHWGVCRSVNRLSFLFEREHNNEVLRIPTL